MADYFKRVNNLTPTQFWINNASRKEAQMAIDAGALGCTNNPSFSWKMLTHPEEKEYSLRLLDEAIKESEDNNEVESILQRKLVKGISDIFLLLWEKSDGKYGYVSIQGDPVNEDDPDVIIKEARLNRELNPNICIKIPATKAGLIAMETLIAENTPINATEIMSVSQSLYLCEIYEKITKKVRKYPKLYLSYIAGIFEEYLRKDAEKKGIRIDPDIMIQAGSAGLKKVYRILQEKNYKATIVSGGARTLRNFTDFVGGDLAITINWKGSADKLLEADPDVVYMINNPVPDYMIDELNRVLPEFKKGWDSDGLSLDEFEDYGPVEYFRDSFLRSWNSTLNLIKEKRG